MKDESKNSLIKLYKQKSQNFHKINIPENFKLNKKLFLSKTKFTPTPMDSFNNQEQYEKSQENSKIFLYDTNERSKQFILPYILDTSTHKTNMNSSLITNSSFPKPRKKYTVKLKKIKIKKDKNRQSITPTNRDKKLLNLYKEDFYLKKKFEKYKEKKAENMKNFSYEKYNLNLLKLSSINLSQDSYNIFKKNMQTIESQMKGQKIKRKNRWLIFLDKIGNFAPEGLKKKIKSLSEHKKLEVNDKQS